MSGKSDHRQNGLDWQQTKDFCAWVAPGGRLPSEAEWEYAASGTHMTYPWGDSPAPTCTNNTAVFNEAGGMAGYGCGAGGTSPVGSKSAGSSWSGALDMAGNVWERCEDWYQDDYDQNNDGVADAPWNGNAWTVAGSTRVSRGGGFNSAALSVRSAERIGSTPSLRSASLGGRCVRPLP